MTAPARAIALTGSNQAAASDKSIFRGITLRETAGAAAAVRVYDNTSAAGTIVAVVALAANASATIAPPDGIFMANGVYISIVSGTIEGSVWIG